MSKITWRYFSILAALILLSCDSVPSSPVTIYIAKDILTLDDNRPRVEAVAVSDGVIVQTGSLPELKKAHREAHIDPRFEDKVLVPGLIDPHVHMTLGAMMYGLDFIPPWDMQTPRGTVKGLPDKRSLLAGIAKIEAQAPDGPLALYGYHNLVQGDITRHDLDKISKDRPLFIWHYSGHDFYLNSAAINLANLTPALADKFHGVDLDETGELTGRIYEDAAMVLFGTVDRLLLSPDNIERGFTGYETLFRNAGVTTVAELGYGIFTRSLEDAHIDKYYSSADPYRLFLVPEHRAFVAEFGLDAADEIQHMSQDTSRPARILPQVKLFTDAAFYSQTMRLKSPGYTSGQSEGSEGLWVTELEALTSIMGTYWDKGFDIRIHSNGDAAQDTTLEAFSRMKTGDKDQRLVIEHGGLFRPEQIERAQELGIGLSIASHYVFYMGQDYESVIGDRVKYITPLRSAVDAGLPVTLHSDAPLAPPEPLRAASVHMTRATRQGGVSTPSERLTKNEALRAITLDAAWALGLEDEIGSIEAGKLADFTVLEQNPLTTEPEDWPTIPVWGVVLGGVVHPVQ